MKTVFIGGGPGCLAVLELAEEHRLATLSLDILGVVDIDVDAPAMHYARARGWPTYTSIERALRLPDLELVIELTGIPEVRDEIYHRVPTQVRVMDHEMARVFWDLDDVNQSLRDELELKTRLEANIRKDRRRLQELLDSLPDVVMVVDAQGLIQRVNRRMEEVMEVSAVDIVGQSCRDRFPRGHQGACQDGTCIREQVLGTGEPTTDVRRDICIGWNTDPGESYYEVTANPIDNRDGSQSVVITCREVTEQVHLKRETEQAARRFDELLAAVHGLITIRDLEGRYEVVNPYAASFFGMAPEDFIGKTPRQLFPADVAAVIAGNDAAMLIDPDSFSHEEVVQLDGKEHVLMSERILLTDYEGQRVGICCVSMNVTEARQLQRELITSEKHAAVGKLAAGVAHEINNPLTGILTFAEDLMEETPKNDPAHDDLAIIVRETLRCRNIVRELLDFSRRSRPKRSTMALKPIIDRSLALVRNQASFHDIDFDIDVDDPSMLVQVDPNQIQQVVLNLIINARDAMGGAGEIRVHTREDPETGHVLVEIEDTGCGIPVENLEKVFEPFFSTKGQQGLGLGLAAVRSIVDQHEGEIVVESEEGRGATFRICLPSTESAEDEGARAGQAAQGARP